MSQLMKYRCELYSDYFDGTDEDITYTKLVKALLVYSSSYEEFTECLREFNNRLVDQDKDKLIDHKVKKQIIELAKKRFKI